MQLAERLRRSSCIAWRCWLPIANRTRFLSHLAPLRSGTHHRFSVRCSHYNAILICERLVAWVIDVEHTVPHCWPKVVCAGSEQQLEDMSIELGSKRTVASVLRILVVCPSGQCRGFVIDEEATVFDRGGPLHFDSVQCVDLIVALRGHVGEPMPWGHADLLRDIVDSVNCTSTIATCVMSDEPLLNTT